MKYLRFALTALLCVLVWLNSHWSVALAITALSLANELNSHVVDEVLKILRRLLDLHMKKP
jgi:hypothetical protein